MSRDVCNIAIACALSVQFLRIWGASAFKCTAPVTWGCILLQNTEKSNEIKRDHIDNVAMTRELIMRAS